VLLSNTAQVSSALPMGTNLVDIDRPKPFFPLTPLELDTLNSSHCRLPPWQQRRSVTSTSGYHGVDQFALPLATEAKCDLRIQWSGSYVIYAMHNRSGHSNFSGVVIMVVGVV